MSEATATSGSVSAGMRPTNVRWLILLMLFVVTLINFACRAVVSVAGPDIERTLGLSSVSMGYIFSAFAWSYVLAQLPGGWLLDHLGSKKTYFIALAFWSVFTVLQGAVGFLAGGAAVIAFFVLRLLVGVAEAPAFPANGRITSAWFPDKERGFASAVFNSAQYAGTALFSPIIGLIVHYYGWQAAFFIIGGIGIVLAIFWNKLVYGPKDHPAANAAEVDYIRAGGGLVDLDAKKKSAASQQHVDTMKCLKELLSSRMLLGLYIYQFCINTLTYFFLTWFPTYLVVARHMTILKAGAVSALPAICGFAGGLLGGWASDRLIKAGVSLSLARKIPIIIGMVLAMAMMLANYVDSNVVIIALMSLAFFGKGFGALGWAVVSDTSPKEAGGLSGALFNTFGNAAGIITPIIIGYLVQASGNFNSALIFVGASAAVAILAMVFMVGNIHRFELKDAIAK